MKAYSICVVMWAALWSIAVSADEPSAQKILGISRFAVDAQSISVTQDEALAGLDLVDQRPGAKNDSKHLTIGVGESFTVSDHHHLSATYTLLKIENGAAQLAQSSANRFPGDAAARVQDTVLIVRAYSDGRDSEQAGKPAK